MAVTVILDLHIKPELTEEYIASLRSDLPDTRAFAGNLKVETVRDQADPNHVTLIERWEQRSDQEKYIAWRTETGTLAKGAEAMSGPIEITYYDELQDV